MASKIRGLKCPLAGMKPATSCSMLRQCLRKTPLAAAKRTGTLAHFAPSPNIRPESSGPQARTTDSYLPYSQLPTRVNAKSS
jgi:hypothetical protein